MTPARLLLVIAAGAAGACSATLDFDGRTPDARDGVSGVDSGAVSPGNDGGASSTSSSGSDGSVLPGTDGGALFPGTDCPGSAGPKPIRVDVAYCIDSTEVTNADYAAFRADPNKKPTAGCEGNTLEPDSFPGPDQLPVVRVDWCSAASYCKWAGKRLCGKIGGGPATGPTTENQWFEACSAKGAKKYPYGDFKADACVIGKKNLQRPVLAVKSAPACVGGSPDIFDMSGNVAEWEDSCTPSPSGGQVRCAVRGGSVDLDEEEFEELACAFEEPESRNKKDPFIGFRCCSP